MPTDACGCLPARKDALLVYEVLSWQYATSVLGLKLVVFFQTRAAVCLLEEMRERGVSPELETYVLIIEGLARQRRPHAGKLFIR